MIDWQKKCQERNEMCRKTFDIIRWMTGELNSCYQRIQELENELAASEEFADELQNKLLEIC